MCLPASGKNESKHSYRLRQFRNLSQIPKTLLSGEHSVAQAGNASLSSQLQDVTSRGAESSFMHKRNAPRGAFHRRYDVSENTTQLDELVILERGKKKMCPREHRNLTRLLMKKKLASQPKYFQQPTLKEDSLFKDNGRKSQVTS